MSFGHDEAGPFPLGMGKDFWTDHKGPGIVSTDASTQPRLANRKVEPE